MKLKILRNLADKYPPYKEGEVRNVDAELSTLLIQNKLAEETDDPLTEGLDKDPKPKSSPVAPISAAIEAREFDQRRAGGDLPADHSKKPGK